MGHQQIHPPRMAEPVSESNGSCDRNRDEEAMKERMLKQTRSLVSRMEQRKQQMLQSERGQRWRKVYDWTIRYRKAHDLTTAQFMELCGLALRKDYEHCDYKQILSFLDDNDVDDKVYTVAMNNGHGSDILEKLEPLMNDESALANRPVPPKYLRHVLRDVYNQSFTEQIYPLAEYRARATFGDPDDCEWSPKTVCLPGHVLVRVDYTEIADDKKYQIKYRLFRMCQDAVPPETAIDFIESDWQYL